MENFAAEFVFRIFDWLHFSITIPKTGKEISITSATQLESGGLAEPSKNIICAAVESSRRKIISASVHFSPQVVV